MKTIITFLFLNILSCLTNIQAQWFIQHVGGGSNLKSVFFVDQNFGWVVGWSSSGNWFLYKTSNGGANWVTQSNDTLFPVLNSVYFINQNTGWAAGQGIIQYRPTRIIKTTNGGNNWFSQIVDSINAFNSIYFIDQNIGYAVGTHIIKTSNGGANWVEQYANDSLIGFPDGGGLKTVKFYDYNTGWAVGSLLGYDPVNGVTNIAIILKTSNGGNSWQIQYRGGDTSGFYSSHFINQNIGFVSGFNQSYFSNLILKTTNGGTNWLVQSNIGHLLNSINFINQNTGWGAGKLGLAGGGIILKTTNAGINWFGQDTTLGSVLNSIFFIDQSTGWAVSDDVNSYILKTTNGGGTIGIEPISNIIPAVFKLYQNYPNPFNPKTNIEFDITKKSFTKVIVYDIAGRIMSVIVNEELKAGSYRVNFDGSNLSSGVYFYTLEADNFSETKKMVILK